MAGVRLLFLHQAPRDGVISPPTRAKEFKNHCGFRRSQEVTAIFYHRNLAGVLLG